MPKKMKELGMIANNFFKDFLVKGADQDKENETQKCGEDIQYDL